MLTTGEKCATIRPWKGKRKEIKKMKDYMEKLEILAYMVENDYCLVNRTMDDMARDFSLEDIRNFCARFMGEDPTA